MTVTASGALLVTPERGAAVMAPPIAQDWPPPQLWHGHSLNGWPLAVWLASGFGDVLQAARYIRPLLRWAQHDAPVHFLTYRAVAPLLRYNFPTASILTERPVPKVRWIFDGAIPFAPRSLWPFAAQDVGLFRRLFGPALAPYLRAPAPRRLREDGLQVGIRWAANDRGRSIPDPALLAPLWSVPGVYWHSLQAEPEHPPPHPMVADHRAELADWSDTANLVSGLDLVLAVDTAVAHLAGALGVPTWMLLLPRPKGGDGRSTTRVADPRWCRPLYRTARPFYQSTPDAWHEPIHRAAARLRRLLAVHPHKECRPTIHPGVEEAHV